ncbi:MAG: hydrogenase maturation nickel metallochaperone HypA [Firmicutes bacterium]|nr:hydrogenase maturation nickel metallochaperone HypA [Bacillota bacterium]
MHELAITEGIMEVAVPAAEKSGAKRILEIRLKVGELSGVIPDCVCEYFSMISVGTIAEGAVIVSETIPASIECQDCGFKGRADRKLRGCPSCGSANIRITGGREYYVDSLKVE